MGLGRAVIPSSVVRLGELRHGAVNGDGLVDRTVLGRASFYYVESDLLQAVVFELQDLCGAVRKVDDSSLHDWTAVVYFDHDGPPVPKVCYPHVASQGKRWVGGGHVVHVKIFAAGGLFSVKIVAIP